ncbi:Pycsar system effector family protein [Candidatus Uabimicrobium amorphum]|uniref:Pycsar effector protein domain-containing protein n=1 Tax=Uabimicrobium amorphum TaxID=2596890 RepID=A0A5S9IKS5_UABAM|nr:Pycsar system effector family protein [Candidatus Uabimicrobium amorphum]BBM82405.1 hypothetical protein UABAM_00748 [Candidatus Uabimicrobium amorphum]
MSKKKKNKKKNNPQPKTSPAIVQTEKPKAGSVQQPLHVDTDDTFHAVVKTYEHTQKWITLADTKSGLVLTVHGVLISFILQEMVLWKKAVVAGDVALETAYVVGGLFVVYLTLQIISFLYAIRVFFPRTLPVDYRQTRHVFNVGMTIAFPSMDDKEKLWQEYKALSEEDLKKEYVYQIHTDGHVCSQKYSCLRSSIKYLLVTLCFAFATFVSTAIFIS